ncbi:MAG: hypothetical protein KBF42_08705 [Chitinophagales bacterium]|jgi:hypothetical protein|nr:Arc family DNA-binding protein [Bacteroidota bacterium]MBK7566793.1 Arc family DNA-binding protein [Bacteroidota bacterium]MBP8917117.1 hypothetical protein [Chitinophagales bacterium]MBP9221451.1 hypothetical protein [Chitinophagales bacterium]
MAKETKKALIIRINPDTIKAIEKWAADDFRSVNGQIEFLLNEALKKSGRYDKNDNDIIDGETGKRFDD